MAVDLEWFKSLKWGQLHHAGETHVSIRRGPVQREECHHLAPADTSFLLRSVEMQQQIRVLVFMCTVQNHKLVLKVQCAPLKWCACACVCVFASPQKAMPIPWNPLNNNHRRKACEGARAWQTTITHQLLHFANNRAEPAAIITRASERASVWALYNCRVTEACLCSFRLLFEGCEVLIYL